MITEPKQVEEIFNTVPEEAKKAMQKRDSTVNNNENSADAMKNDK